MPAALAFVILLGLLAAFQLALALGAPWGRFAWGGQYPGVLPRGKRIGSLVTIVIYAVVATIALDRAAVIDWYPTAFSQIAMWVVVGLQVLAVIPNAMSRSKQERFTMTPITVALAVLAIVIALG